MNKIGCMPPLLGKDSKLICNTKFNVSKQSYWDITILFWSLYYHDREYECRKPCTKSTYTSTFVHKTPSPSMSLILVFDDTIDVANTFLSIDGQTLLTRLGGSVSSGRTLLWILGIIFAASQVSRKFFTRKKANSPGDQNDQDEELQCALFQAVNSEILAMRSEIYFINAT